MIIAHTATIYKTSHGRRFLTKRAAYLAEALHRMKRKEQHAPQGCDGAEDFYTNEQWDHFKKIASRYYRRFGRRRP